MRIENQKNYFYEHFLDNIVLDFEARFDSGAVLQCEIRIANDNRIVRLENCCRGLHKLDTFRFKG